MRKILLIIILSLALIPVSIFSAKSYSYQNCGASNNCYLYANHSILTAFNSGNYSTIYSTVTKKDSSAGGYVYAELWSGYELELGSLIDRNGATLTHSGDWVRVHYNKPTHNSYYDAIGTTQLSSSHKMLANVQ